MDDSRKGILAMLAASGLWGLSPLLYHALGHVPPLEVLAHRTIWSLIFFGLVLALQGRLNQIGAVFKKPLQLLVVLGSAILISFNWGVFTWAIPFGRMLDVSLGYFIYPLMSVFLGAVLFREKLGGVQIFAVAMIVFAVILLAVGLGVAPWISLALAGSFAIYGVVKKQLNVGPVVSVTTEVLLLLPLALIWLWGVHSQGWTGVDGRNLGAFGRSWYDSGLLMLLGLMTGGPLVLFAYAAKRLGFATQGLVFYLSPSLHFLLAALVFGEVVSRWHMIAFPMIWAALVIYSINAVTQERALRKAAAKSSTVSIT